MPRYEIITESSTFLTYEVEARSSEEARKIYEAGNANFTGSTDTEEKLIEINLTSEGEPS